MCIDCKMPASNLAKVFGPTIVGYSSPDPEPMTMLTETKKQAAVSNCYTLLYTEYFLRCRVTPVICVHPSDMHYEWTAMLFCRNNIRVVYIGTYSVVFCEMCKP